MNKNVESHTAKGNGILRFLLIFKFHSAGTFLSSKAQASSDVI